MEICKDLTKIDSILLADYILMRHGTMSHLKLQKLLFYCDAYHLAFFDEELVTDQFEAWVHGPVSRKVFNELKDSSLLYAELTFSKDTSAANDAFDGLTSSQKDLITMVLNTLSTWDEFQLETATHKENPWIEARIGYGPADKCTKIISKESMRTFYKAEINA